MGEIEVVVKMNKFEITQGNEKRVMKKNIKCTLFENS